MQILFYRFAKRRRYMNFDDFAACLSRLKIMDGEASQDIHFVSVQSYIVFLLRKCTNLLICFPWICGFSKSLHVFSYRHVYNEKLFPREFKSQVIVSRTKRCCFFFLFFFTYRYIHKDGQRKQHLLEQRRGNATVIDVTLNV